MTDLPSGTVTLLFTDIEESTELLRRLGDSAYAEVLAEHQRLLRAAFRESGGREVSTLGDGFLVVFHRARDAVSAAIVAQRAIMTHPWAEGASVRVRMGIHTGDAIDAPGGYIGLDVHRAARICAAAHGGQVLLSDATRTLVKDSLPQGVTVRDLSRHRLPSLSRPQQLFQIVAPDLQSDFPALRSLSVSPNNLPVQLSSFIGREREIAELKRLLATTHLLTLTGAGGAGKTRLALQVAVEVLQRFKDGVWLVELGALSDPNLVAQTVASTLSVREQRGDSILSTLASVLQHRHLLLIIDNCEHVVDASANVADTLLRADAHVQILATSREPLGIIGEVSWPVPPLSLPAPGLLPPLEHFLEYEGIRLFVERAVAALPTFTITERNAVSAAQICQRLDGMPLAIELAAARVNVLPMEQIAARLDDRFRLLTSGTRGSLPRNQTLMAAMDWSFNLLPEREQVFFRRLSVFAGGFTLEAAEAICAGGGIEASSVLDLLAQLVKKSLVMVETEDQEARYRLLETVREYGRTKLVDAGETPILCQRHRDWYLGLAERAEPRLFSKEQSAWFDQLEMEHDNFREALEWSLKNAEYQAALRLAGALHWFWHVRGYFSEGRRWLERAMAEGDEPLSSARAKAIYAAGSLAHSQGDYDRAIALGEASRALYQRLGDEHGFARSLVLLGFAFREQGEYARAHVCLEQGLSHSRKFGDTMGIGMALNNLGEVARCQGDYATAGTFYEEALPLRRILGDERGIAVVLDNLGRVAQHQGDYDRAVALFREALAIRHKLEFKLGIATTLAGLAGVAAGQGYPARAGKLLGAAEALLGVVGAHLYRADRLEYERTVAAVRAAIGETAFAAALDEGRAMSLEQAIGFAMTAES